MKEKEGGRSTSESKSESKSTRGRARVRAEGARENPSQAFWKSQTQVVLSLSLPAKICHASLHSSAFLCLAQQSPNRPDGVPMEDAKHFPSKRRAQEEARRQRAPTDKNKTVSAAWHQFFKDDDRLARASQQTRSLLDRMSFHRPPCLLDGVLCM